MPATPEQVQKLQKKIDEHRKTGVTIDVSEGPEYDGEVETIVSIAFSDDYDAFEVGEELEEITGPCDTGAGFGYRDLQLCAHWPGLK